MCIAIPTEVENNEFRVVITPVGVYELVRKGHEVYARAGTGVDSSTPGKESATQGAKTVNNTVDIWEAGRIVIRVKEPISNEYQYLCEDLTLFAHLHLVADRPQADALLKAGTTAIAYETVQLPLSALPLSYPMFGTIGSLVPQVGTHALMKAQEGRGVLMDCIGGVPSAKVVVLSGGAAGQNTTNIATGFGAGVMVLDTDPDKLRNTFWRFYNQVHGVVSSALTAQEHTLQADLVVGTVLIPGAEAPKLVTNDMVAEMESGSVLVDVTIGQGGRFEDSHSTTHDDPTFLVHSSQFYYVANISGVVSNVSTRALTNAILPYAVQLADKNAVQALKDSPALAKGLNMVKGSLTFAGASEMFNLPLMPLTEALDHVG